MHSQIHLCYHGISTSWLRNVNPKPCRDPKQSLHTRSIPCSQDRLTHVQLLFTWNPSPLQSSKFSFEYLLRPPSSALGNATPRLRPYYKVLCPPTHWCEHLQQWSSIGHMLERHPFSGLIHSAGGLLHTPWRISTFMSTVLLVKWTNTLL